MARLCNIIGSKNRTIKALPCIPKVLETFLYARKLRKNYKIDTSVPPF